MMQVVQVADPGTTCSGVTPLHEICVDAFEDRILLTFHARDEQDPTATIEIGNQLELDLETWDRIAVIVKNRSMTR